MTIKYSNNAVTMQSLCDLPIVIISAWRYSPISAPQTVTYGSFLANFNNGNQPGHPTNIDSGLFTPGYYTVSYSAFGVVGPNWGNKVELFLYKNNSQLPKSLCEFWTGYSAFNADDGMTGGRILLCKL